MLPDPDPVQQRSSDNYLQSDCSVDSFSLLPRPGCFFLLHKNGLGRHRRSGQQQGERIGRFLRNGCCVTIFPGIHIRIDISFFILQTVPEIGIVRIDADAALLGFLKAATSSVTPESCHIQIADGYLFQICRRVLIEVRSRFRFLRFQAHSLIV